jgi:hypothetical protein
MPVDKNIAENIAYEVKNYVGRMACGVVGYAFESIDDLEYDFPKVYAKLKAMKRKPRDCDGSDLDDVDGDGSPVDADCDDDDPDRSPGFDEICDMVSLAVRRLWVRWLIDWSV